MILHLRFMAVAALALGACQTTPPGEPTPTIVTRDVRIPLAVTCDFSRLGTEPAYPDTDAAIDAAYADRDGELLARLYKAGRLVRIARDEQKTAAINACASAPLPDDAPAMILQPVKTFDYVGACRYTGYIARSIRLTLECGHEQYRKASRGIPERARCVECERNLTANN